MHIIKKSSQQWTTPKTKQIMQDLNHWPIYIQYIVGVTFQDLFLVWYFKLIYIVFFLLFHMP